MININFNLDFKFIMLQQFLLTLQLQVTGLHKLTVKRTQNIHLHREYVVKIFEQRSAVPSS